MVVLSVGFVAAMQFRLVNTTGKQPKSAIARKGRKVTSENL